MTLADIASLTAVFISSFTLFRVSKRNQIKKLEKNIYEQMEKLGSKYDQTIHEVTKKLESIEDQVFCFEKMQETLDHMRISMIEIKERIHFQSFLKEASIVRPITQLQIPLETNKKSEAMKKAWETRRANAKKEE